MIGVQLIVYRKLDTKTRRNFMERFQILAGNVCTLIKARPNKYVSGKTKKND